MIAAERRTSVRCPGRVHRYRNPSNELVAEGRTLPAGGRLRLRDAHEQERRDREESGAHVDHEDAGHREKADQQRAERRRDDVEQPLQRLVHPLDPRESTCGDEERSGGEHGGLVERAAQRAREQQREHVRRVLDAEREQRCKGERGDRHEAVGAQEDRLPVPAVYERADDRAEDHLRQESEERRGGKDRGGAGRLREPPDERELDRLAAEKRQRLSGPQGEEGAERSILVGRGVRRRCREGGRVDSSIVGSREGDSWFILGPPVSIVPRRISGSHDYSSKIE